MQRSIAWSEASDIKKRVKKLVIDLELDWVDPARIFCMRSTNSKARAYARIWGFSRIWQQALEQEPAYCVEVLSEKFDHLNQKDKDKVILHELAHIPRTFSGALLPHTKRGKGSFHDRLKTMIHTYNSLK